MISSKHCISNTLNKIAHSSAKKDCTVNLARQFSRTCVLERRINTRRPRPPCYEKALFIEISKPKFPPNPEYLLPSHEKCQKARARQWLMERKGLNEENIFQNILAKEILARFEESQMIAIVHRSSMLAEVNREVKVVFKRVGMTMLDRYGRATIEKALTNTKYISIMPLFKVSEAIIVSPEAKVDVLLKTLKKTPQLTLMATIVDNRLLSKTETEMYATTNLATQQALLVQTISSVATSLTSQLNHHSTTLVSYLDQHSGTGGEGGTSASGGSSASEPTSGVSEGEATRNEASGEESAKAASSSDNQGEVTSSNEASAESQVSAKAASSSQSPSESAPGDEVTKAASATDSQSSEAAPGDKVTASKETPSTSDTDGDKSSR